MACDGAGPCQLSKGFRLDLSSEGGVGIKEAARGRKSTPGRGTRRNKSPLEGEQKKDDKRPASLAQRKNPGPGQEW